MLTPILCLSISLQRNKIFNKIAIQETPQMAADKEAIGLSTVHMYESKCK